MSVLREWACRLRGMLRRSRAEAEWAAEIQAHLELAEDDARRRGAPSEAAARAARLRAGGTPQALDALRDQHGVPWLEDLWRDTVHGLQTLTRNPGFAGVALLTLALGIGASTAIFSVVDAVLLRPLPFLQPDRLVSAGAMLSGEYLFLADNARTIREMALYQPNVGFNLSNGVDADRVTGAYVSANLFSTLGVTVVVGRTFRADEDQHGEHTVVLSHALWRQRFGADAAVVGREVMIDSEPHRVVGVMPPTFNFPTARTELWIPYTFNRRNAVALWGGGQRGQVVARLAPGSTPAQAQADLRRLAPALRTSNTLWAFPPAWGTAREVVSLQDRLVGDVRQRLLVLLGAVGAVLLIACANVATLLLARASARQREMTIRRALGAGRGRIIRQLLTESAWLGVLGGALGLVLAAWGTGLLVSSLPVEIPRVEEIGVDYRVLGITLVVSVLSGLGFGVIPSIRLSRSRVPSSLTVDARGSSAAGVGAASLLVVGQVAIAVLLVIGAGLLIRSLAALLHVDPGFRSERIITARITPPERRYVDDGRLRVFYGALLTRARGLAGVQAVEAVSHLPLVGGTAGFAFEVEGQPYAPGTAAPVVGERGVTVGYLPLIGVPLVQGRALADTDHERSTAVAVVNETMARSFWPGADPVGRRFKPVWNDEWITVVGVVGDAKDADLASDAQPVIYRPFLQKPARDMSLVVRMIGESMVAAVDLRATVASLDPTVAVSEIRTLDEILSTAVAAPRFTAFLLAGFAAVALLLAAMGIYGLLSYVVSGRIREIGIRMALGARRLDVLRLVLGRALLLAGAGVVGGVAAARVVAHVLASLLFTVRPTDPVTFGVTPLVLLCAALVAAGIPAARAIRVDPATALRLD